MPLYDFGETLESGEPLEADDERHPEERQNHEPSPTHCSVLRGIEQIGPCKRVERGVRLVSCPVVEVVALCVHVIHFNYM